MHVLIFLVWLGCSPTANTDEANSTFSDTAEEIIPGPQFVADASDGESVEQVEPARYLGLWYEIATTPSQQQSSCSGTTAEYSLIDESTIGVTNRCRIGGLEGRLSRIEGTARPIDDTYARLLVDLGFGFEAPYTIVDLYDPLDEEPYAYATVSANGVTYWILSRTPQIPDEMYDTLLDRIDERGGDSSRLIRTEQPEESAE